MTARLGIGIVTYNRRDIVLETLKERWFTLEFAAARPDVIARRMQQVIETDAQVFLSVFDIYAETEMAPWLHEVTAPSLVLTGEFDGGCPPRRPGPPRCSACRAAGRPAGRATRPAGG